MMVLKNPALLDIAEAHGKQADTECTEDGHVKDKMRKVLKDVKDGSFAKRLHDDFSTGMEDLKRLLKYSKIG